MLTKHVSDLVQVVYWDEDSFWQCLMDILQNFTNFPWTYFCVTIAWTHTANAKQDDPHLMNSLLKSNYPPINNTLKYKLFIHYMVLYEMDS